MTRDWGSWCGKESKDLFHHTFSLFRLKQKLSMGGAVDHDYLLKGKPKKIIVDDQAANPSSWKTPRMALRIVS